MAEWLMRAVANCLGFAREGSNPSLVACRTRGSSMVERRIVASFV